MDNHILIVDDDLDFAEAQSSILESHGYQVQTAHDLAGAKDLLKEFVVHVALIDIRLGAGSGLDLVPEIQRRYPKSLCVMSTGVVSANTVIVALQKGAYDYLCKPYFSEDLLATMRRCFERIELEEQRLKAEEALKLKIWRNRELEQINRRLKCMVESMKRLAHCSTISELCPLVLEQFGNNLAANGGSVYLFENGELVLKHALDPGHAPSTIPLPLRSASVFSRVISTRQPQLVSDRIDENQLMPSGWSGYGNTSLLAFPLLGESNEILGVLSLHEKKGPHFNPQDQELGKILAAYISEAIRAVKALEDFRHSEEQVRLLLNSTGEGIFGVDKNGDCTFVNSSCLRMLGYARDEALLGKNIHGIVHQDTSQDASLAANECEICQVYQEETESHLPSTLFSRANGDRFPVECWSYPIRNEDNQIIGSVVTFIDITQRKAIEDELDAYRKQLEEKVKRRTAELTSLNEELSAFAHSISHDLKAPLRAIEGFSGILCEEYGDSLDQAGNEYLGEIRDSSVRMAQLIDDLLAHARLSERFAVVGSVDMSELLERVRRNLSADIASSKARISVDPELPVVHGHSATLETLMQNLISNALKFVAPSTIPEIEISVDELDTEYHFRVRDNGIGIDAAYAESIFDIFNRLHSEDEYPGTGIGLAIAKKAVGLHKGRIWMDSEIGSGSSFHFTLSKQLTG